MDIEYKKLKKTVEASFKKIWGPRCEVYDLDEWPDLKKANEDERCSVCRAYDKLDIFVEDLEKTL